MSRIRRWRNKSAVQPSPSNSGVVKVFTTGTVVQVFSLAGRVATDVWSDSPRPLDGIEVGIAREQ
jgi:hypothetical protein